MAFNTQHQAVIFFLSCVMLSAGVEFKYLKYNGPDDTVYKYTINPWPVILPGDMINITGTVTPAVDIFDSTIQYELISKETGQIISAGVYNVDCRIAPQICNWAAGETRTLSYSFRALAPPPGFKGTFIGSAKLYNQDQDMWFGGKTEAVV